MSIPNYSGCYTDVVGCPKLFEDLEAILGVVWSRLSTVLGDNPCSQNMETYVSMPMAATDSCNRVMVFPLGVSVERPQSKTQIVGLRRTRIEAGIIVMFDGFPDMQMLDNVPVFPAPVDLHNASRFLISLAWCVMCEIMDSINNGTLLGENDISLDGNILNMELLQPEGACGGFMITMEVFRT